MVINGSNGVTDADIGLKSILNQIKGDCRPGIFLRKVKETGPEAARRAGGGWGSYTGFDWMEGVVSDPRPFIKSNIHAMPVKTFQYDWANNTSTCKSNNTLTSISRQVKSFLKPSLYDLHPPSTVITGMVFAK